MATKIKLMRLGKMRAPYYRVVVADSRTKRDGRAIETIGKYHPKEDPSFIDIDKDRALYWLRVGAQPTEAVAALLKVTGAWQEFKGLPAPAPMLVAKPKADKKAAFEDAHRGAVEAKEEPQAKARPAKKVADKTTKDKATKTADAETAAPDASAETPAGPDASVTEASATESSAPEATADAAATEATAPDATAEAAPAADTTAEASE